MPCYACKPLFTHPQPLPQYASVLNHASIVASTSVVSSPLFGDRADRLHITCRCLRLIRRRRCLSKAIIYKQVLFLDSLFITLNTTDCYTRSSASCQSQAGRGHDCKSSSIRSVADASAPQQCNACNAMSACWCTHFRIAHDPAHREG